MKRSKKIKLITSLSSIATISSVVPLVATSCFAMSSNNGVSDSGSNTRSIDIKNIAWVKTNVFNTSDANEIKAQVKQDNNAIFNGYVGLESCVDITVDTTDLKAIAISITRNGTTNPKYTGTTPVSWTAKYDGISPTPTPTPTPTGLIKITYSNLKYLVTNKSLVSGQQYQITDYMTTVNNATAESPYYDTARALGNQFDIVVTALSNKELNEDAKVVLHENDTYFTNNILDSWKVKYCIDNDTNRFDWADTENGKGVIYYMKDEFDNEAPYDFKNIQFSNNGVNYFYTFDDGTGNVDTSLSDITYNVHKNIIKTYNTISDGQRLNNIVIIGDQCFNNSFGYDCNNIKIANGSVNGNKFLNNCHRIYINQNFSGNTFNTGCSNIHITTPTSVTYLNNTFGNGCANFNITSNKFENVKLTACVGESNNPLAFTEPLDGNVINNAKYAEIEGPHSVNFANTSPTSKFTVNYGNETTVGGKWELVDKNNQSSNLDYAQLDQNGTLTVTGQTGEGWTIDPTVKNLQIVFTKDGIKTTFDVRVVPGSMNKIVTVDADGNEAVIDLQDNIPQSQIDDLRGSSSNTFHYTDTSGVKHEIDRRTIKSLSLTSVSNDVKEIKVDFLFRCSNLVSVDLSGLNNVETIGGYFLAGNAEGTNKLTTLDLSAFTNVKSIGTAFLACSTLITTLDLTPLVNVETIDSDFLSRCADLYKADMSKMSKLKSIGKDLLKADVYLRTLVLPQPADGKIPTLVGWGDQIGTWTKPKFYCGDYTNDYVHADVWKQHADIMVSGYPSTEGEN